MTKRHLRTLFWPKCSDLILTIGLRALSLPLPLAYVLRPYPYHWPKCSVLTITISLRVLSLPLPLAHVFCPYPHHWPTCSILTLAIDLRVKPKLAPQNTT
ncbi:hypothetical protein RRG08_050313 [Elysia crispata]|uniref:Uncharacterized protein n=1 Tax=Elysia crispata TaxID=231223 RepID=A0AAE0ZYP2_9GAST|nr:hypothetical protein RRG08_050313 [Elysia crispata]